MEINWFKSEKYFSTDEPVKINWFNSEKITDLINENLTDSDLDSNFKIKQIFNNFESNETNTDKYSFENFS